MIGTRYEEYRHFANGLPFVLSAELKRTRFNLSPENNWHENLEIQLCNEGRGTVLLDGRKYAFDKDDIIVVNSNVIHYTATDTFLNYSCLIIDTGFCRQAGIDPRYLSFESAVRNPVLLDLLRELIQLYTDPDASSRIARLDKTVLEILIELNEHHTVNTAPDNGHREYETVKSTILYLRENYSRKLTLDEIAQAVLFDKYALCREFKKLTGQTVIEHLNNYRCIKAIDYLAEGYSVSDAAFLCGFENLSFFTKTFKQHIGRRPSEYKK